MPASAIYCHGVDNVKETLSELLVVSSNYYEGSKDSVEASDEGVVYYFLNSLRESHAPRLQVIRQGIQCRCLEDFKSLVG